MQDVITAKAQGAIPKAVRDHLGVRVDGHLKFFMMPDGTVMILPVRPITDLRGFIKTNRRLSLKDMEKGIAAGATRKSR